METMNRALNNIYNMNKHIVLMKFKSSSFIKKVGVLLCFVAFALSANAQTRKVTGQIVDGRLSELLYGYRMLRQVLLLILTVTFR
jgi:hypothetical protein